MIWWKYCCSCRDDLVAATSVWDEYDMNYCSEECRDEVNVPHFNPLAIASETISHLGEKLQFNPKVLSEQQKRAYKMYLKALDEEGVEVTA